MKTLMTILMVFIVSTTIAQNPKRIKPIEFKIELEQIDEFDGHYIMTLEQTKITKGVFLYAIKVDSTIFLNFATSYDLGCSGVTGNYVTVLFKNGLSVVFDNDLADINCQPGAYSMYQVSQDQIDQITQVQKIRIKQSDRYQDYEIQDPETFINLFKTLDHE